MKLKILLICIIPFLPLSIMAQDGSLGKDDFFDGFSHPRFPGGDVEMYKFINERLVYPPAALKAEIEGRVIVRFTVSEKGDISNVHVPKSLHPDCDSVAINIVKAMPRWLPGKQRGRFAAIDYFLPIIFRLPQEGVEGEIYTLADRMPEFPGGKDSLFSFIRKNLRWPNTEVDFQGRVTIRFVVTKEGKAKNPKVIRGISPEVDLEAMRIIRLMPDWIPGRRNGEAVNVYYMIPVAF